MTVDRSAPAPAVLTDEQRRLLRERLGRRRPAGGGIPRRRQASPVPLGATQERIWFLERLAPGGGLYNLTRALRLEGAVDVRALAGALAALVERHEALRTAVVEREGEPAQAIVRRAGCPLPVVDLGGLAAARRSDEAGRLQAAAARRPFDLGSAPLLRTRLLRLGAADHLLVLTLHHLVADGWSLGVLCADLGTAYRSLAAGRAPGWSPPPVQFADFAAWERERLAAGAFQADLDACCAELGGELAALDLPADRPRPPVQSFAGATLAWAVPPSLEYGLRALARAARTTPFAVLLAGWGALLARYSGQRAVLVGSPVANRGEPELEGVVGCFVNTLVFRVDLDGDPTGGELVGRVRDTVLAGLARQRLPFARLVETLAPVRRLDRMPLFETELVYQNAPRAELAVPGLEARVAVVDKGIAEVELSLEVEEGAGGLVGELTYATGRYDAATVERIRGHLETLLAGLVAAPERPVGELSLLGEAERTALVAALAAGPETVAAEDLAAARIARQAAARPDAVAVVAGSAGLSFGELWRRAARLARRLRAAGVGTETPVGVLVEPSAELVVAVVGVLASGGVLLPLDPDHPERRRRDQLDEAAARWVVTRSGDPAEVPPRAAALAVDGPEPPPPAGRPTPPAPDPPPPASAAYLLFTSGSTGRPKGVVVSHAALAAHCAAAAAHYRLGPDDRVLQFASPAFDVALEQILAPLSAGAALVIRGAELWSPHELGRRIAERALTVVNLPPGYWAQLLETHPGPWPPCRLQIVGGEALPPALLAAWGRVGEPRVRLLNAYGPTETTITATTWEVPWPPPAALRRVPVGGPLAGRKLAVVDRAAEPQPMGVAGEVWLGGAGLARGYLGRPRATAEAFVPDPFSRIGGARLYRTGDLGRALPGGEVEFLGRLDRQVKVRGFRIELEEIEAVLGAHPEVREAAVVVRTGAGTGGDARLAAYVASAGEPVPAARLRAHLAARLPGYMVPAELVSLPALPRTASGKLDRRALPRPAEANAGAAPAGPPPRTWTESVVSGIWSELLGRERIAVDDNFFDLGGHSLHATRLTYRLGELLGVALRVRDLFEAQTLEALAARVERELSGRLEALDDAEARRLADREAAGAGLASGAWGVADGEGGLRLGPYLERLPAGRRELAELRLRRARDRAVYRGTIPRRRGAATAPLSWSQEILWFVETQLTNPPSIYRLAPVLVLGGRLDAGALAAAFDGLGRRHEVLRTRFGASPGGDSFQQLDPAARLTPERIDLTGLPAGGREAEARRRIEAEAQVPFDLTRAPLMRPLLFRLEPERHWLVLSVHHIVLDDWSAGVLYRDLVALYNAARSGRPPALPPLPIQYADYAAWERERLSGEVLDRLAAYWHGRFGDGLPQIRLRTDRPRPPLPSYRGSFVGARLDEPLGEGLRRRAREEGVSLFMALLAGFELLLAARSGQLDVMVACANANRPRAETELLLGSFFNLLLLRTDLGGDPTLGQLLARIRDVALAAYDHQDFPFILVAPGYRPPDLPAGKPPIQALFTFQNTPPVSLGFDGLEAEVARVVEYTATDLDLLLSIRDEPDGLLVYLIYDSDLFEPATAEAMVEQLRGYLAAIAGSPGRRLSELDPPVPPPAG